MIDNAFRITVVALLGWLCLVSTPGCPSKVAPEPVPAPAPVPPPDNSKPTPPVPQPIPKPTPPAPVPLTPLGQAVQSYRDNLVPTFITVGQRVATDTSLKTSDDVLMAYRQGGVPLATTLHGIVIQYCDSQGNIADRAGLSAALLAVPKELGKSLMPEVTLATKIRLEQFVAGQTMPSGMRAWPDEHGTQPRDASFGYVDTPRGRVHINDTDWIVDIEHFGLFVQDNLSIEAIQIQLMGLRI